MTFAERFSQLLQHLLRNLLQRRQSVWKALLWGVVTVVVIGFVAGLVTVGYLLQDLPPITGLHEYQPSLVTRVYSADKQVIGQFFVERRILVPLDKIPRQLVNALVAIEDSRFFEHRGLDFVGIARAAITNRSEEHTSELQSLAYLVCRLLLEKKKKNIKKLVALSIRRGS